MKPDTYGELKNALQKLEKAEQLLLPTVYVRLLEDLGLQVYLAYVIRAMPYGR